jgi:predicted CopG family antitoxin
MKNKKVMSIAIRPELHEELKKISKRKGLSASEYVGNLVEQAVKINPDEDVMVIGKPVDEDVTTIILKIPVSLKTRPDLLQDWLDKQTTGIMKAMKPKEVE